MRKPVPLFALRHVHDLFILRDRELWTTLEKDDQLSEVPYVLARAGLPVQALQAGVPELPLSSRGRLSSFPRTGPALLLVCSRTSRPIGGSLT